MSNEIPQTKYLHDHGSVVLRSHGARTVANAVPFLKPYLKPGMKILDVGCGPGSITLDVASNYAPGSHVTGIDQGQGAVEAATASAKEQGITNVEFAVGNVHHLQFPDDTFDLVYAHQVIQYVPEIPRAMKELLRVTKPGGHIAIKEADFSAFVFYPEEPAIERFKHVFVDTMAAAGGEARAAARMKHWALEAGYDASRIKYDASTLCFATPEGTNGWANTFIDRIEKTKFRHSILDNKVATEAELNEIVAALKSWKDKPDAVAIAINGEFVYTK